MKNRNWFWGLFFLLSAVFVIAVQTGSFGEIGVLSILATILIVALVVQSIISRNFFGVFFPAVFLYYIYRQPLNQQFDFNLPNISVWILLLSALFASIGFSILFKSHPKVIHHPHVHKGSFNATIETSDDNNPYAKVSFGSSSKYLHGTSIKSGQFIVSFGALEVFFDQAQLDPEGAEIFLDCSFGAIELNVPRHWRVQDNLHASLGGVENNARHARPSDDAPVLTLTGNVSLGGVEIKYI